MCSEVLSATHSLQFFSPLTYVQDSFFIISHFIVCSVAINFKSHMWLTNFTFVLVPEGRYVICIVIFEVAFWLCYHLPLL